jgi:hypothetical protein
MPKFPEPPKDVPTTFKGNGTPNNGAGNNKPTDGDANNELDFDALAKRFEELKKKL